MSSSTSGGSSGGAGRQPFRISSAPRTSEKPSITLSTTQRTRGRVDTTTLAGVMEASRTPERAPSPTIKAATPVTVEQRLSSLSPNERIGLQVGGSKAVTSLAMGDLRDQYTQSLASKPGTLAALGGAMSKVSIENQIKQLREGGTPVFDTDTGKTVGVVNKRGQFSGDAAFQAAALKAKKGDSIELSGTNVLEETRLASKESESPQTKTIKAEEEEVAVQAATTLGGAGRGRGTRGKRFGAGGTILEGTGALYD